VQDGVLSKLKKKFLLVIIQLGCLDISLFMMWTGPDFVDTILCG